MKTKVIALLTGTALGVLLAAVLLVCAPGAYADEATFITALDDNGLPAGTTALTLGHAVCSDIIENGVAGVDAEMSAGLDAGMSSHDVAAFVVSAVNELCPSAVPAVKAWTYRG
jgi:hypothetical protein